MTSTASAMRAIPALGRDSDDTDGDGICDLTTMRPTSQCRPDRRRLRRPRQRVRRLSADSARSTPTATVSATNATTVRRFPTPGQTNCDFDNLGDACDPDTVDGDGDSVADGCDNCPGLEQSRPGGRQPRRHGDACAMQGRLDTRGCYRASDTLAPRTAASRPSDSSTSPIPAPWSRSSSINSAMRLPIGFGFSFTAARTTQAVRLDQRLRQFRPGLGDGCCGPISEPVPAQRAGGWAVGSSASQPWRGDAADDRHRAQSADGDRVQRRIRCCDFGRDETFEIILDEASGDIVVQFAQASNGIVGIEDPTGTMGLQWAGPEPAHADERGGALCAGCRTQRRQRRRRGAGLRRQLSGSRQPRSGGHRFGWRRRCLQRRRRCRRRRVGPTRATTALRSPTPTRRTAISTVSVTPATPVRSTACAVRSSSVTTATSSTSTAAASSVSRPPPDSPAVQQEHARSVAACVTMRVPANSTWCPQAHRAATRPDNAMSPKTATASTPHVLPMCSAPQERRAARRPASAT